MPGTVTWPSRPDVGHDTLGCHIHSIVDKAKGKWKEQTQSGSAHADPAPVYAGCEVGRSKRKGPGLGIIWIWFTAWFCR